MARKFLIAIAAIVAIMAALAIVPAISNPRQGLSLDYSRESLVRGASVEFSAAERLLLAIEDDGSATYSRLDSTGQQTESRRFTVGSEDLKVLRELFLGTGFMQIPVTSYPEKAGLSNFTRYQLVVESGGESKSIQWVNPEAASTPAPSIITNAGNRLDMILTRYAGP